MSGCFIMFNRTVLCDIRLLVKSSEICHNHSKKKKKKGVVFHPWTALLHQVRSRGFSQRLLGGGIRRHIILLLIQWCVCKTHFLHISSTFFSFVHFRIKMRRAMLTACLFTVMVLLCFNACCLKKKAQFINFHQTDIVIRNLSLWCVFLY